MKFDIDAVLPGTAVPRPYDIAHSGSISSLLRTLEIRSRGLQPSAPGNPGLRPVGTHGETFCKSYASREMARLGRVLSSLPPCFAKDQIAILVAEMDDARDFGTTSERARISWKRFRPR